MTNYTIINNNIITANISHIALRVYLLLLSMCFGDKDYCFPSQAYIAEKLHVSVRTVQRALKELEKIGYIKIKRRGSISNLYTVLNKVVSNTVNSLKETVNKAKNSVKNKNKTKTAKTGKFDNFTQRNYNFKNLEDMLLGNKEYNSQALLE